MLIPVLMLLVALAFDAVLLAFLGWRWWHDSMPGMVRAVGRAMYAPFHLPLRLPQRGR
jgi:hypothetical protein